MQDKKRTRPYKWKELALNWFQETKLEWLQKEILGHIFLKLIPF